MITRISNPDRTTLIGMVGLFALDQPHGPSFAGCRSTLGVLVEVGQTIHLHPTPNTSPTYPHINHRNAPFLATESPYP